MASKLLFCLVLSFAVMKANSFFLPGLADYLYEEDDYEETAKDLLSKIKPSDIEALMGVLQNLKNTVGNNGNNNNNNINRNSGNDGNRNDNRNNNNNFVDKNNFNDKNGNNKDNGNNNNKNNNNDAGNNNMDMNNNPSPPGASYVDEETLNNAVQKRLTEYFQKPYNLQIN